MSSLPQSAVPENHGDIVPQDVLQSILQALDGLRFGQVTVIVQDGRVIQIDRTERAPLRE